MTPEVLITKEMEEEERQLMEEGERKEKELIEKVCFYPRKKKAIFVFIHHIACLKRQRGHHNEGFMFDTPGPQVIGKGFS